MPVTMLERAIALAVRGHAGQVDKAGQPYILHPLRVMLALPEDETLRCAGVLHDALEDTVITIKEIETNTDLEVVSIVESVTRRMDALGRKEVYADFIQRAAAHPKGQLVKLADILDNVSRLSRLPDEDERNFLESRYQRALAILDVTK